MTHYEVDNTAEMITRLQIQYLLTVNKQAVYPAQLIMITVAHL